MDFNTFKDELKKEQTFKNINLWKFKKINHGIKSPNKYIVSNGKKKYFVKEVKPNESVILGIISKLSHKISPKIFHSVLLSKNILVQEFVKGGHLKNFKI